MLSLASKRPLCSCQAQMRAISSQKGDKGTKRGNNTPSHSRPYAGLIPAPQLAEDLNTEGHCGASKAERGEPAGL